MNKVPILPIQRELSGLERVETAYKKNATQIHAKYHQHTPFSEVLIYYKQIFVNKTSFNRKTKNQNTHAS